MSEIGLELPCKCLELEVPECVGGTDVQSMVGLHQALSWCWPGEMDEDTDGGSDQKDFTLGWRQKIGISRMAFFNNGVFQGGYFEHYTMEQ